MRLTTPGIKEEIMKNLKTTAVKAKPPAAKKDRVAAQAAQKAPTPVPAAHEVTQLGIRFPADIKAKLEKLAEYDDRTLTSLITKILREWVKEHEAEIFYDDQGRMV